MGLLWYYKQKFGNVRIHVVFKTTYPESNSGIFLRIGKEPETVWDGVHHGYEVQICDAGPDAFDDFHRTGAIYSLAKVKKHAFIKNAWNTFDIMLQGESIVVYLNAIKINEFHPSDPTPPRHYDFEPKRQARASYGYIGIQNHDHNATQADSHVYFKEISVHPLKVPA